MIVQPFWLARFKRATPLSLVGSRMIRCFIKGPGSSFRVGQAQTVPTFVFSKASTKPFSRGLSQFSPNDAGDTRNKLAKFMWITSIVGSASIFGGGLITGHETLFPAWAFFHGCGASASLIQRQPFEVFMHCSILIGVLFYWGKDSMLFGKNKPIEVEDATQDTSNSAK